MKWFDYLACILYADIIAAGVVYADPMFLIIGILLYCLYETVARMERSE